jgi:hypothetical protein
MEIIDHDKLIAEGFIRTHILSRLPVVGGIFRDRSHDVYYHPGHKVFTGKVEGHHFKTMNEKGLYQHLTDKHGWEPSKADQFIHHVKSGNKTGFGAEHPLHHSERAVQHMRLAREAHFDDDHEASKIHADQAEYHFNQAKRLEKKTKLNRKERTIGHGHAQEAISIADEMDHHTAEKEKKVADEEKARRKKIYGGKKEETPLARRERLKALQRAGKIDPEQASKEAAGHSSPPPLPKASSQSSGGPPPLPKEGKKSEKQPMNKKLDVKKVGKNQGQNESINEDRGKPLAKLQFHKDSEMFHGHILDQEVKPQKEQQLFKFLTTDMEFNPDEATKLIRTAKEPAMNDAKRRTHEAYSKLWASYARKTNNPQYAKEFKQGADYHGRRAKVLGQKFSKEEEGAEEAPKPKQQREDTAPKKEAVIKEDPHPLARSNPDFYNAIRSVVTEAYVEKLVEDLGKIFAIEHIDQILTGNMGERLGMLAEQWCRAMPNERRRERVLLVQQEGKVWDHIKRNKYAYLGAAAGAALGATDGTVSALTGAAAGTYIGTGLDRFADARKAWKQVEPHLNALDMKNQANDKMKKQAAAEELLTRKRAAAAIKARKGKNEDVEDLDEKVGMLQKLDKKYHNFWVGKAAQVKKKMEKHRDRMLDRADAADSKHKEAKQAMNKSRRQLIDTTNRGQEERKERSRVPHDHQNYAKNMADDKFRRNMKDIHKSAYNVHKTTAGEHERAAETASSAAKNWAKRLDSKKLPTFGKASKTPRAVGYGGKVYESLNETSEYHVFNHHQVVVSRYFELKDALEKAKKLEKKSGHNHMVGSVYRNRIGKMWDTDGRVHVWSDHHGTFVPEEK